MSVLNPPRRAVADLLDLVGEAVAALATTGVVVLAQALGPGPEPRLRVPGPEAPPGREARPGEPG